MTDQERTPDNPTTTESGVEQEESDAIRGGESPMGGPDAHDVEGTTEGGDPSGTGEASGSRGATEDVPDPPTENRDPDRDSPAGNPEEPRNP